MKPMGDKIKLSISKSERLRNVKQIEELFKNSSSVKAFPLIFSYLNTEIPPQASFQILFAAPKRNFKKAVDRNRIKRVMRDRFRLLKPVFYERFKNRNIVAALIYTAKELPDYRVIDKSLLKILSKIND